MWKDITSYSRMDKERSPKVLECVLTPRIKFTVHKYIYCGDTWFLSSDFVGANMVDLVTTNLEEAKQNAVEIMLRKLKEERDEVARACQILSDARDSLAG